MSKIYSTIKIEDMNLTQLTLVPITVQTQTEAGTWETITVVPVGAALKLRIQRMYGSREFLIKTDEEPTESDFNTQFATVWSDVFGDTNNQRSWGVVYKGLYKRYDPVENYDRYTETETAYTGTEKSAYSNHDGSKDTVTTSVSPESNSTFFGTNKTESERGPVTEDTTKSFTDRKDSFADHTHGNIGIMTAAQAIQGEMFRFNEGLTDILLQQFIYRYTF